MTRLNPPEVSRQGAGHGPGARGRGSPPERGRTRGQKRKRLPMCEDREEKFEVVRVPAAATSSTLLLHPPPSSPRNTGPMTDGA
ncbi:hypothetical protein CRUP_013257 [Coryphaenoides rupestris]|nr:hypothetical protein CRUP_013257 [Coryphaenoides rupestris]